MKIMRQNSYFALLIIQHFYELKRNKFKSNYLYKWGKGKIKCEIKNQKRFKKEYFCIIETNIFYLKKKLVEVKKLKKKCTTYITF